MGGYRSGGGKRGESEGKEELRVMDEWKIDCTTLPEQDKALHNAFN